MRITHHRPEKVYPDPVHVRQARNAFLQWELGATRRQLGFCLTTTSAATSTTTSITSANASITFVTTFRSIIMLLATDGVVIVQDMVESVRYL